MRYARRGILEFDKVVNPRLLDLLSAAHRVQTQPELRVGGAVMRFASGSLKEQGGSLQGQPRSREVRFRVTGRLGSGSVTQQRLESGSVMQQLGSGKD